MRMITNKMIGEKMLEIEESPHDEALKVLETNIENKVLKKWIKDLKIELHEKKDDLLQLEKRHGIE